MCYIDIFMWSRMYVVCRCGVFKFVLDCLGLFCQILCFYFGYNLYFLFLCVGVFLRHACWIFFGFVIIRLISIFHTRQSKFPCMVRSSVKSPPIMSHHLRGEINYSPSLVIGWRCYLPANERTFFCLLVSFFLRNKTYHFQSAPEMSWE